MDLKPTAVFLHDPRDTDVVAGLETNEFSIAGILPYVGTHLTTCDITCATPCTEQTYTIVFADVVFGDCNACGMQVGFNIRLRRQSNFDIEDYLHLTSSIELAYEPDPAPSGTVTAQTIRDYFLDQINNGAYDDEHDWFGITGVALTTTGITFTVPCPIKVDIFQSKGSEPIVITETAAGTDASLSKAQLMKEYPLVIGYVPGQAPDDTFTNCEDICVIEMKGCIPGCVADAQNLLTTSNAVHLHDVGTKFHYKLFVNSSAPQYLAFITALNATAAACTLTATLAQAYEGVQMVATGGSDDLGMDPFCATGTDDFNRGSGTTAGAYVEGWIYNGETKISFLYDDTAAGSPTPWSIANLATYLNGRLGGASAFSLNGTAGLRCTNLYSKVGNPLMIVFTKFVK
jgi:hypothetical protein